MWNIAYLTIKLKLRITKENLTIAGNSTFQKLGLSYFSLFIVDFSEYC
jgi:hypothetical protein